MNLRETIRSGYKVFSRMAEDKRKSHILAVQYVETLANQTNTKMEPWDLLAVFGTGKGNELVTDKNEINKRFFSQLEELKNKTPAAVFALEARLQTQIDNLTRAHNDRAANEIKRQRDQQIRSATDFANRMNTAMTEAHKYEQSLMAIERRESTITQQISRLVQESYWEFHELNGALLNLLTKNEIILTQKNPAANLDLRVNMGRFKLEINLNALSLRVLKHTDNLDIRNYYHPHVTPDGSICWGTASGLITTKLPKGEIYDSIKLLEGVLSNYNDGNPYVHLADFQKVSKNSAPPKEGKREGYRDERPTPPGSLENADIRINDLGDIGIGGIDYATLLSTSREVVMDPIIMNAAHLNEALNRLRGIYSVGMDAGHMMGPAEAVLARGPLDIPTITGTDEDMF